MTLVDIRCISYSCAKRTTKRVHSLWLPAPKFMPDAIACCEFCGGYTNGKIWKYVCNKCGSDVASGELVGLFVPHLCRDCLKKIVEEQSRVGDVCGMCRQVRVNCCC